MRYRFAPGLNSAAHDQNMENQPRKTALKLGGLEQEKHAKPSTRVKDNAIISMDDTLVVTSTQHATDTIQDETSISESFFSEDMSPSQQDLLKKNVSVEFNQAMAIMRHISVQSKMLRKPGPRYRPWPHEAPSATAPAMVKNMLKTNNQLSKRTVAPDGMLIAG